MDVSKLAHVKLRLAERALLVMVIFVRHNVIKVSELVGSIILYRVKRLISYMSTFTVRSPTVNLSLDPIKRHGLNSRYAQLVLRHHVLSLFGFNFL